MATAAVGAVLAPFRGVVVLLEDLSDPVFAQGMAGAGLALEPADDAVEVRAPVAGRVRALHPHAVVLQPGPADGPGGTATAAAVLVHLGLDTVRLRGRGFELLVGPGDVVAAGQPLVRWDVTVARAEGLALTSPIVVVQAGPQDVRAAAAAGSLVGPGDVLLEPA